jgi:chromosome partitioning protein
MAVHMSVLGYRVLAIDCDPQAHLSYVLGVEEDQEYITLYDVIVNNMPLTEAIINIYPGLDLVPSDISLTRAELPLSTKTDREKVLKKSIKNVLDKYDFIFLDTNPTISILNQNATYCADVINIVCETQPLSLKGLDILINELKEFYKVMDIDIPYRIIPNKYESKTATSQEVLGILHHDYKETVMESIVRRSEDINQSSMKRLPVCAFAKKRSVAFEDMCDLSLAILEGSSIKQN